MTPDRPNRRGRDVPWADPVTGPGDLPLGYGRSLTPDLLRKAYAAGVFPWYNPGEPVLWWSPDPRAVIELDGLHVSRRLARTMKSGKFRTTVNRAFTDVMLGCGENRAEGTWVHDEMVAAYTALHAEGDAHSVEVWAPIAPPPDSTATRQDAARSEHPLPPWGRGPGGGVATSAPVPGERRADAPNPPGPPSLGGKGGDELRSLTGDPFGPGWELVGGIYGVAVGGLFAGESMFHRRTDASKVALVALVERLRARGFVLFDVQMTTDHTERMGAVNVSRAEYLARLAKAVKLTHVRFADEEPPPAGESREASP